MKHVAIFSGSFNPIHIGHTALANYICEYENIDEVWFVVTPQNPLKDVKNMTGNEHRLKMVELATKGYKKFFLSDIEMNLPRPSYTIRTLEALKKQYPENHFVLIIGADNWDNFHMWKESDRIIKEFGLIVYPRKGFGKALNNKLITQNVVICNAPEITVSSSLIREAYTENKDLRFFLSEKVYEYIATYNLYR